MAKGRKTGGRKKGSVNKVNRPRERAKALAGEGQTPLDYMLMVMRNPKVKFYRRDDMAKAAAPYLHARKAQQVDVGNVGGKPFQVKSDFDFAEYRRLFAEISGDAGTVSNGNGSGESLHPAHTNGETGDIS